MKKIFTLIVALVAMTSSAMALENEPEAGLTWQGLFGLNLSNFRGGSVFNDKGQIADQDHSIKPGFNLGVRAEYMLPSCKGVFINGGLNYTMKGAKCSATIDGDEATLKARACYIELPIHIGYRYNFSEAFGVYADFGPYFALGVNGKTIADYDDDAKDNDKTRFFRNSEGQFKDIQRFDFGLGYRIGAEYNNQHSLTMGMDWGLTDMYTGNYRKEFKINPLNVQGIQATALKNFNWYFTYGYRF